MKNLCIFGVLLILSGCAGTQGTATETKNIASTVEKISIGSHDSTETLERIFYFVRDQIEFNWIYPQDIPAEEVLNNGYGVCMQKANLFSAMAQTAGFQTRFHFVYVHKQALEDFLPAFAYKSWVDPFPHTVVEVLIEDKWISFDPSFDIELHKICLERNLNFGKYPEICSKISTDFSIDGVKGAQQFWETDKEGFYGTDLSPLMEFDEQNVPLWKKLLKPMIFRQAHTIMDSIRGNK